jgi:hypothetical protein
MERIPTEKKLQFVAKNENHVSIIMPCFSEFCRVTATCKPKKIVTLVRCFREELKTVYRKSLNVLYYF